MFFFQSDRPRHAAILITSAAALALVIATPIWAEPAPSFAELLRQTQATSPQAAEAQATVEQAEALARQARTRVNPEVSIEVENFAGGQPYRALDQAEVTVSVGQRFELGRKRSARIAVASAEVEVARRQAARSGADFKFELATAYAAAEAAERRLILAQETVSFAEEDARAATAFAEAGREPDVRRFQANAALQAARAAVDEARAARSAAFANLSAVAGLDTPITSISISLLDQSAPIFADASATPGAATLRAAEAERDAAQRRVEVQRTLRTPDVTISVGVRRFQEYDTGAFVAGASVSLPLFDQNRGNIEAAQAEVRVSDARVRSARLQAEAVSRTSTERQRAADARLAASREGVRAAEETYRLTRIGYEAGKLSLTDLLNARRALTEARGQTIDAAVERVSAQAAARLSSAQSSEIQR